MKISIKLLSLLAIPTLFTVGCMQEFEPKDNLVSKKQVMAAPNAYENLVDAVTSTVCGEFTYAGRQHRGYDFGYPAFFLVRDVMGQDIFQPNQNWWSSWYTCSYLGPTSAVSQLPWTYYYGWIKNCNVVIGMGSNSEDSSKKTGLGIAYAMRAMFYMDLARMYGTENYADDKSALTVPIILDDTSLEKAAENPRATNEQMWAFILDDLNKAESLLKDYQRPDKTKPDLSVVYGFKARAYLAMSDWSNAQKYAKLAQAGYNIMSSQEYTDRDTGFNTPNNAWMLACRYNQDQPNIRENDGDSSWGSMMCLEVDPEKSGCGYASNYGGMFLIDRHLYETIPTSDIRKKCFVDFAIDQLSDKAQKVEALKAYSDYPAFVYNTGYNTTKAYVGVGGLSLKFRLNGGLAGRENQMIGFSVAVPMMRVEEMYLIEAEAAGMQNEQEGISLLEKFAKLRDPSYVYGKHNEAYGNPKNTKFQNEIWWQRRVEFWGEGFATFDIKRYKKGIIRSYANTDHQSPYLWNTTTVPEWMNLCIVQTESNYNHSLVNNPAPVAPANDSPEFVW